MNKNVEVELKALILDKPSLVNKIKEKYDLSRCLITNSDQLNHYFDFSQEALIKLLEPTKHMIGSKVYDDINLHKTELLSFSKVAIRTRYDSNQGTVLIFKYSLIDDNSENGTTRKELEFVIPNITIEKLDVWLLICGFTYQSKWSRKRTQYTFDSGWSLCLDSNSGYGDLLEVEYVATEEEYANNKDFILYKAKSFLNNLELEELDTVLLTAMFKFYSKNFYDFYGKEKYIWEDSRFGYNKDGSLKYFSKELNDLIRSN